MIRDKIVSESLINVKKEENEEKEGLPYNNIEKGYNFNPEEKHQRKNKCHYNDGGAIMHTNSLWISSK